MRTTTATLDTAMAAQRQKPISRVTIRDMRLRFSLFSNASNPWGTTQWNVPWDSVTTTSGAIIRVMMRNSGGITTARVCRTADPSVSGQWDDWTDLGFAFTDYSLGLHADEGSPETIYLFYHLSGTLRYRTSADDGVTWSSETDTGVSLSFAVSDHCGIAPISPTVVWVAYRNSTGSGYVSIERIENSGGWAKTAGASLRFYDLDGIDPGLPGGLFLDAEGLGSKEYVQFSYSTPAAFLGVKRGRLHLYRYDGGVFDTHPITVWQTTDLASQTLLGWRLSKIQNRLWLSAKYRAVNVGNATEWASLLYSDDGESWCMARDFFVSPLSSVDPGKAHLAGSYVYTASAYAIYRSPATYLIDPAGDPAGKKVTLSPTDEDDLISWQLNFAPGGGVAAQGTTRIANGDQKYESGTYNSVVRAGSELWREAGYATSAGNEYVPICRENIDVVSRSVDETGATLELASRDRCLKRLREWVALDYFDTSSQLLHFDPFDDLSKVYTLSGTPTISTGKVTNASETDALVLASSVPVGTQEYILECLVNPRAEYVPVGLLGHLRDKSNYIRADLKSNGTTMVVRLLKKVAGISSTLESVNITTGSTSNIGLRLSYSGGTFRVYTRLTGETAWTLRITHNWSQATTPWNWEDENLAVGICNDGTLGTLINTDSLWVYDLNPHRTMEGLLKEFGYKAGIDSFNFSDLYTNASMSLTGASAGNWGTGTALTGIDQANLDLEFDCPALSDGQRVGVSFRSSTGTWAPTDGYTLWLDNTSGNYTATLAKNALSVVSTYPIYHAISGATHWRLVVTGDFFSLYLNGALINTFHDTSNPSETSNKVVLNCYGANKTLTDVRIPELYNRVENVLVDIDRDGMSAFSTIIRDQSIPYFCGNDGALRASRFLSRENAGTYGNQIFVEQLSPTDFEAVSHVRVYSEDIIELIDTDLAAEHGFLTRVLQMPTLSTAEAMDEAERYLVRAGEAFDRRRIEMTGQLKPEVEDTIAVSYTTPSGLSVSETIIVSDQTLSYSNGELSVEVGGRKQA